MLPHRLNPDEKNFKINWLRGVARTGWAGTVSRDLAWHWKDDPTPRRQSRRINDSTGCAKL